MESHFLFIDDIFALASLAKIPRVFIWEKQNEIEQLGFYIDSFVKVLFAFAWTFPKFDHILLMTSKKLSKVIVLQLRNLRVGLGEEPCIGFI